MKTPNCHPDREYWAKGLCNRCYRRNSRREYNKLYYREWRKIHPKYDQKYHLKRNYNISLEDYQDMYTVQEGKCFLCSTFKEVLHVDHCHKLHTVRKLLCPTCNTCLRIIDRDISWASKAMKYVYGLT